MTQSPDGIVFQSDNERAVTLITDFLKEKAFEVEVIEHPPELSGSDALGISSSNLMGAGQSGRFEVAVKNGEQLQEARQLIAEQSEDILLRAGHVELEQAEVLVDCEECEKTNVYSGDLQGSVQECQHCGSYLDVPGGEDDYDWSIVDETISEDEEAAQRAEEEDHDPWM